jgi:hypothetical protein
LRKLQALSFIVIVIYDFAAGAGDAYSDNELKRFNTCGDFHSPAQLGLVPKLVNPPPHYDDCGRRLVVSRWSVAEIKYIASHNQPIDWVLVVVCR